jgi:Raf kinase inhibitor-like YbhB/YbcL family protein
VARGGNSLGLRGLFGLAVLVASGCTPGGSGSAEELFESPLPETVAVTSAAFEEGGDIPVRHTCDGEGSSPALAWSGVPGGAVELAVVVDDPDAPGGTYVHWVLFGLSPRLAGIGEGAVPEGARQARNSAGDADYAPPCPPGGSAHHYRFAVYALATRTGLGDGVGADEALQAIREAALSRGVLVGLYRRG